MIRHTLLTALALCLASCATKVTPEETIAIASSYVDIQWMPEQRHIRHGFDASRIFVHTPDTTLAEHGDPRGWWKPGILAKGMPYKWGGFDTPETFLAGLKAGKKAGDIANDEKIRRDNAAVSDGSIGVDCSGFISRCWKLTSHVSTKDMPAISKKISWDDLQPGDILLKRGHVILFHARDGSNILGYESAPMPTWRVRRGIFPISYLKQDGYSPWRYRHMLPSQTKNTTPPRYQIDSTGIGWNPIR